MEYIRAMIVGGLFCVIAQILIDQTTLTPARILTFYVCAGVILTGIGFYDWIVEIGGCGATVPLTGFGYSLANGVKSAVDQYGLMGALTGGLTATSGGIAAAIAFSLFFGLIFSGKPENL